MTFFLNGKPVDALALIVHRSAQETVGRQWVNKLREAFCIIVYIVTHYLSQTGLFLGKCLRYPFRLQLAKRLLLERHWKPCERMSLLVFMEVRINISFSQFNTFVYEMLGTGHYERKMKHLENQKEGKRRMKRMGTVDLPQEAFFDILSNKKWRWDY